jgi:hypothetical protein
VLRVFTLKKIEAGPAFFMGILERKNRRGQKNVDIAVLFSLKSYPVVAFFCGEESGKQQ